MQLFMPKNTSNTSNISAAPSPKGVSRVFLPLATTLGVFILFTLVFVQGVFPKNVFPLVARVAKIADRFRDSDTSGVLAYDASVETSSEEGAVLAAYINKNQQFSLLPENNRYFQYKGLPFVSFADYNGVTMTPRAEQTTSTAIVSLANHGNHFYMTGLNRWVRINFKTLYDDIVNPSHWQQVEAVAQWAYDNDVMLNIIGWSYWWDFEEHLGEQGFSDMVGDPAGVKMNENLNYDDSDYPSDVPHHVEAGTHGLFPADTGRPITTRMDLHRLYLRNLAKATWNYPNVTYTYMWEYYNFAHNDNYPSSQEIDEGGKFHRWWVNALKNEGQNVNPQVDHLFSIAYGGHHPKRAVMENGLLYQYDADFIVSEGGTAIIWPGATARAANINQIMNYNVPLVYWFSDVGAGIQNADCSALVTTRWSFCKSTPGDASIIFWGSACGTGQPTPCQLRELATTGWNPANNNTALPGNSKEYAQQLIWYMENILTWGDEQPDPDHIVRAMGDEINLTNLPVHKSSGRPTLSNVAGYTNGAIEMPSGIDFAVTYSDPEGRPPAQHHTGRAQAEVWVDMDGDGRFNPNISAGERILMTTTDTDFRNATYKIDAVVPQRIDSRHVSYVFRFADSHWYPPVYNDLFPTHYGHLLVEAEGVSPELQPPRNALPPGGSDFPLSGEYPPPIVYFPTPKEGDHRPVDASHAGDPMSSGTLPFIDPIVISTLPFDSSKNYNDFIRTLGIFGGVGFAAGIVVGFGAVLKAAYEIMTSSGDPEKLNQGWQDLVPALVGAVLISLTGVIIGIIFNLTMGP
jgi:hypothetical protein